MSIINCQFLFLKISGLISWSYLIGDETSLKSDSSVCCGYNIMLTY